MHTESNIPKSSLLDNVTVVVVVVAAFFAALWFLSLFSSKNAEKVQISITVQSSGSKIQTDSLVVPAEEKPIGNPKPCYESDTEHLIARLEAKVANPDYARLCIVNLDWFNEEIAAYSKYIEQTYGIPAHQAYNPEQYRRANAIQAKMWCKCEEWAEWKLAEMANLLPFTPYDYVSPIKLVDIMTIFDYRHEDLNVLYTNRREACVNMLHALIIFVRNNYTPKDPENNHLLLFNLREIAQCAEMNEKFVLDDKVLEKLNRETPRAGISFLF